MKISSNSIMRPHAFLVAFVSSTGVGVYMIITRIEFTIIMEQEYVSLSGTIENIIYRNNDNGWTVLELNCVDELVTVVGSIFQVSAGDELNVKGEWVTHSSY